MLYNFFFFLSFLIFFNNATNINRHATNFALKGMTKENICPTKQIYILYFSMGYFFFVLLNFVYRLYFFVIFFNIYTLHIKNVSFFIYNHDNKTSSIIFMPIFEIAF